MARRSNKRVAGSSVGVDTGAGSLGSSPRRPKRCSQPSRSAERVGLSFSRVFARRTKGSPIAGNSQELDRMSTHLKTSVGGRTHGTGG